MTGSRQGTSGYALIGYTVLACGFGWMFVLVDLFRGGGEGAGQFPLGPIIAAALVSAVLGRAALRRWGRELASVRTLPGWYLFVVVAPVAIMVAAVLVNALAGAPLPNPAQLAGWRNLGPTFLATLVWIGIGEEAGWTAFAAPRLLEGRRFLEAWLILATIRTVWHLPLMLSGDLPLTLGIGGNFAFQFLVLWLFRRTGVWFLAAVWHATLNTVGGNFFFPMAQGTDQARLGLLMVAGYWILVGAVLVFDRPTVTQVRAPEPVVN
jgi:membrane protease YdiL (CAAX protease family)